MSAIVLLFIYFCLRAMNPDVHWLLLSKQHSRLTQLVDKQQYFIDYDDSQTILVHVMCIINNLSVVWSATKFSTYRFLLILFRAWTSYIFIIWRMIEDGQYWKQVTIFNDCKVIHMRDRLMSISMSRHKKQ